MKKFIIALLVICWCGLANATSLNIPYQNEQPGAVIKSGDWNANMNNIDGSTNISTAGVTTSSIANGAVTNAKIDNVGGIFTYGDVYGSSLITLSGIQSSAGEIPTANLGTGTATNTKFLRGDSTWNVPIPLWGTPVQSLSSGTSYLAATDGLFICNMERSVNSWSAQIYTDGSNPPTTAVSKCGGGTDAGTCTTVYPVKSGNYYKCTGTNTNTDLIEFWPL